MTSKQEQPREGGLVSKWAVNDQCILVDSSKCYEDTYIGNLPSGAVTSLLEILNEKYVHVLDDEHWSLIAAYDKLRGHRT